MKLILLDGYSLLYRAYHALSIPMNAPDGTPTNAIHGFLMMLCKIIEEEKPDYLGVAFDARAKTFRAELYEAYKGTRKPMPDDLRAQDPIIREIIGLMGIPTLELPRYEADDILGTVSKRCAKEGVEAVLVTGDRDSFQLADANTTIVYTKKGIAETCRVTPEYIMENYGVTPTQLIDVKALMGDASDNIPGVPGIGEKTAYKLIRECGSLDAVLDTADTKQKGKLREQLLNNREQAYLCRKLAAIDRDIPLEALRLSDWKLDGFSAAIPRMRELGLNSVVKKLTGIVGEAQPIAARPAVMPTEAMPDIEQLDADALAGRCQALSETARWAAIYIGNDFSVATDAACLRVAFGGDLFQAGVSPEEALAACRPLLEKPIAKIFWDIKALPYAIEEISGEIFDVKLAAYALNPQREDFGLESLCAQDGVAWRECAAWNLYELRNAYMPKMARQDCEKVYREIELPLAMVLRDMERVGMPVDADVLRKLGDMYRERIAALTEEIYGMAGEKVNLNSPKQVSEMLFERLNLPAPKKTKSGYSTDAAVLEGLAKEYPICAKILEYRKLQKLDSTYIQALLRLRDAEGRVHTRFDQVSTATGRISSLEPNLQNIPVRTELGREIRSAFVARQGWIFVDADYSQIELRVLAHMSGDKTMIEAFRKGQDIHARTAAEVAGIPIEDVTPSMRSAAKAVNFGMVYGISDFTLAQNLSISRQEAKDFMERYFARYPDVQRYLTEAVAKAHELGYASTLMNRRRYLPELRSENFHVRAFGERCAMNSPIQGTAADIIKLAMIRAHAALRASGLRAKLVLQVHDELIIECPIEEREAIEALLRDAMENVLRLDVPLRTDISVGGDWRACK